MRDSIKTRPRIKIVPTPTDVVVEVAAALGLLFVVITTLHFYPELPQRIPTHSNLAGKVDGWGSKSSMVTTPVFAAVSYLLLSVVALFPFIYNYPVPVTQQNAERLYRAGASAMRWLKAETIWMLAYGQWQTVQIAFGRARGVGEAFAPVALTIIGVTLVVMIAIMYRSR